MAKLAGVPQPLLDAAEAKLQELENASASRQETTCVPLLQTAGSSGAASGEEKTSPEKTQEAQQLSFLTFMSHPAVEMLKSLDLMNITPSGAIAVLEQLKKAAEETM